MFSLFSPLTGKTENVLCEFYFHSLCGEHLVEGEATPSMIIVLLFEQFFFQFSYLLYFVFCLYSITIFLAGQTPPSVRQGAHHQFKCCR